MHSVPFKERILSGWMLRLTDIVHPGIKIFDLVVFLGRDSTDHRVFSGDHVTASADRHFLKTYTVVLGL